MASNRILVQIIGDASSATAAFAKAGASAEGFGAKAQAMGSRMTSIGRSMSVGFTLPIVGAFGYAVKQAADFQGELNTLRVVSQATGAQMGAMRKEAIALGADVTLPATSASDAAQAMTELAKAGLSVRNTMSAARGVLQLSAAAQISNAEAATITANALNAYSLKGSQATHVADLLAASSIAASGEMTDMADALKYASSTAAQAGVSITDTVTAIGEMANKGIIGGQAGAALQQMFLRLQKAASAKSGGAADALKQLGISIYDAQGRMVSFRSIIDQFSRATEGLTQKQRDAYMNVIFGSRAIRAANIVLLGGVDAFDKMRTATDRQGAAADVAKAKMQGFKGALQALQSSVETLAIQIGTPLLGALTSAARGFSGLVNAFGELSPGAQRFIMIAAGFVAVLGPVLFIVGQLVTTFAILATPVGAATAAVMAAGVAISYFYTHSETFRNAVNGMAASVSAHFPAMRAAVVSAFNAIRDIVTGVSAIVEAVWRRVGSTVTAVARTALGTAVTVIRNQLNVVLDIFRAVGDLLHGRWGALWGDIRDIVRRMLSSVVAILRGEVKIVGRVAFDIGRGIIDGILHGISGLASSLADKLKSAIGGAVRAVKGFFVIRSPSLYTAEHIGVPLGEGVVAGYMRGVSPLAAALIASVDGAVGAARARLKEDMKALYDLSAPLQSVAHGDAGSFALASAQGPSLSGAIAVTNPGRTARHLIAGAGTAIAMASGGLVTSPHYLVDMAGRVAGMIGEAGTEAVVPVRGGGRFSGGGGGGDVHVSIEINAPHWIGDQRELAQAIKSPAVIEAVSTAVLMGNRRGHIRKADLS